MDNKMGVFIVFAERFWNYHVFVLKPRDCRGLEMFRVSIFTVVVSSWSWDPAS